MKKLPYRYVILIILLLVYGLHNVLQSLTILFFGILMIGAVKWSCNLHRYSGAHGGSCCPGSSSCEVTLINKSALQLHAMLRVITLSYYFRYFTGTTQDSNGATQFIKGTTSISDIVDDCVKIFTIAVSIHSTSVIMLFDRHMS